MLDRSSALLGSLGLIVAAMKPVDDEARVCATQNGVSDASIAGMIRRFTAGESILVRRLGGEFAKGLELFSSL